MWSYDKRLQFPVKIKNPNPQTAKIVISQLGGPDGELGASMRYLNQRYAMPYKECKGILTDIGTEELAHMEMISAIVYQLTRNLTPEQIKEGGFDAYFVDHTTGIYPQSASGVPWSAATFQSKGDPITDLFEDMAAEQKARTTYDNLLRLIDDPDVREPLKFLREREVVHFHRSETRCALCRIIWMPRTTMPTTRPSTSAQREITHLQEMVPDRLLFCANTASIQGTVQNKFEHFTM